MWDGDPVSLHPHPPVESAKRFVDLLGAQKILDEGKRAFDAADYRWAAEILHKLVFAQPENTEARNLQADVYEQMGLSSRGGRSGVGSISRPPWSSVKAPSPPPMSPRARTVSSRCPSTSSSTSLQYISSATRPPTRKLRIDFVFTDRGDEAWTAWVKRGVLNARKGASPNTQLTVSGPKAALVGALLQPGAAAETGQGREDFARRRRISARDAGRVARYLRSQFQYRHAVNEGIAFDVYTLGLLGAQRHRDHCSIDGLEGRSRKQTSGLSRAA